MEECRCEGAKTGARKEALWITLPVNHCTRSIRMTSRFLTERDLPNAIELCFLVR